MKEMAKSQPSQPALSFTVTSAVDRKQEKYPVASVRQQELTAGVADLITECMLPLRFTETHGFQKFMTLVDSRFRCPSRRTVSRQINSSLAGMQQRLRLNIQEAMAEGNNVIHATIDLWSSRNMEPIIGVRFHYFDTQFKLVVKTAAFRHFGERHSAENISMAFETIVAEYEIPIHTFGYQVTDNARNMIKAFEIFSLHGQVNLPIQTESDVAISVDGEGAEGDDSDGDGEGDEELLLEDDEDEEDGCDVAGPGSRMPCIAHTLQLAIKDAIRKVPMAEKVLKEANAVVVFFHRSLYWSTELKKRTDGRTLLSAVPTRWNSSLTMLRRLSMEDIWKAVAEVLAKAKATPDTSTVPRLTVLRSQVVDLVSVLTPFEEATNTLQGDEVTSSLVIPALTGLDYVLSSAQTSFTSLQQHLRTSLFQRFQHIVTQDEYVLCTLLDCRYKLIPFPETATSRSYLTTVTQSEARRTLSAAVDRVRVQLASSSQSNAVEPPTTAAVTNASNAPKSIFSKFSQATVAAGIKSICSH